MAVMAWFWYSHKYGHVFEIQQKCKSTAETDSKSMRLVKMYGQNKLVTKIKAISFVFQPKYARICLTFFLVFTLIYYNGKNL